MADNKSRLEINGRIYDAKTGRLLRVEKSKASVVRSHQVIDGIVRTNNKRVHRPAVQKPAQSVHAKKQSTKRLHPALAQKQKPSKVKRFSHSQQATAKKLAAAKSISRSRHIARHARVVDEEPAAVTHVDEHGVKPPSPIMKQKTGRSLTQMKPAKKKQPKPMALQADDSDVSWWKRHLIPAAASFAALALLGGFLVYNSLPNLSMRVAASRAGFNASVPSYHPSGFSFGGPISYGPGRVVIQFDSSTNDTNYTIAERKSTWDSQSLLDNYVETEAENYLTFEEHGLTVYLYDNNQATWVDNGVWYVIDGDAKLNSEQLLKIAASL